MTVVVDLGCYDHGIAYSLGALIEEYAPSRIYGFDPHPSLNEGLSSLCGIPTTLSRKAAWLFDGEVEYRVDGTGSKVGDGGGPIPCFDLSAWLQEVSTPNGRLIVKMDVEGAEYPLLQRLKDDGTDKLITELLVEWHGPPAFQGELACPMREWWM